MFVYTLKSNIANNFLDRSDAIIFLWKVASKLWELYSQKNNPTHDFIVLEISCSLQTAHSKTYV